MINTYMTLIAKEANKVLSLKGMTHKHCQLQISAPQAGKHVLAMSSHFLVKYLRDGFSGAVRWYQKVKITQFLVMGTGIRNSNLAG